MKGQVARKTKAGRHEALMSAQREISLESNRAFIGKPVKVLVEGMSEYGLKGRASSQAPDVDGAVYVKGAEALPGEIIEVTVTDAGDYDLFAEKS
jgi:ribosomal protein S12 methylthiotransferase